MAKRDYTDMALVGHPKHANGKPTTRLLEGTYCIECGAFLAPPGTPEDERINRALEHIDVCPGKHA